MQVVRPLILVTCWRRSLPTFLGDRTLLDTLDPAYADHVAQAGGRPLLVSRPAADLDGAARELIALADGLLLSGGGDVDPASYGAGHESVADENGDADRFELALLREAHAAALPTLGICRGAELLAVAHGGRLTQCPATSDAHPTPGRRTGEQIRAARHAVSLAAGSRVRAAFGSATIAVNSIHRHQISDPGDLRVTALAPDDAIEAVEPSGDWSCVAVQWHPEKLDGPESRALFERFVADARAGVEARLGATAGSR